MAALPDKKEGNSNSDVRGLLSELKTLAEEFGVVIVMITHCPKSGSTKAVFAAMGALGFLAAARSAWLIAPDPADPKRRLMLCSKHNIGPDDRNLAFRTPLVNDIPRIEWDGAVTMSADEALHAEREEPAPHGPKSKKLEAAIEWLSAELADLQEHPVADLKAAANEASVNWRTVERASNEIDVRYHRSQFGSGYVWRIPKPAPQAGENRP
jgi:hypothetical protein